MADCRFPLTPCAFERELATMRAEITRMRAALRLVEWAGDMEWCDACKAHKPKHNTDCPVEAALRPVSPT